MLDFVFYLFIFDFHILKFGFIISIFLLFILLLITSSVELIPSRNMTKYIIQFGKETLIRMKDSVPTVLYYARHELTPPRLSDIPEIKRGISAGLCTLKSGSWKNLTVGQGFLNLLVATEVTMWFFAGEVVGRRHLKGYHQDL